MIEIFVFILLIIFVAFVIFTFISYTSLILNLILLIVFFFLIRRDLKQKDNHKYYLASLFLTALFFIFSSTGLINDFLVLTEKMLLSIAIVSVIATYVFANSIAFIYEYLSHLKKQHQKKN